MKRDGCVVFATWPRMNPPQSALRNSQFPRLGHHLQSPKKGGAPDLELNWPNHNHLRILRAVEARDRVVPKWHRPPVLTWTALAPRSANEFGSRRAGRAERRKAMETQFLCRRHQPFTLRPGRAKRRKAMETRRYDQLDESSSHIVRGGLNAERQWRLGNDPCLSKRDPHASGAG